jgi:hypothetical protein
LTERLHRDCKEARTNRWFKLHELAETKEGIVRSFDEHGYWVEGGSLAEYLRMAFPGGDVASPVQFVEYKRIHWIQKVSKGFGVLERVL